MRLLRVVEYRQEVDTAETDRTMAMGIAEQRGSTYVYAGALSQEWAKTLEG
jgi:hypothetical protein